MEILTHVPLPLLSSFHSLGIADTMIKCHQEQEVTQLVEQKKLLNQNVYILGGGCNTLFNGDFSGILLKNEILGIEKISESDSSIYLKVGGGEDRVSFVKYCTQNNYAGIENLSEIPGTVGAAPVQNIGAYGVEVADVIDQVHGVCLKTGEKKIFSTLDCEFGYRDSIFKRLFKNAYFITYVVFKLQKYTTDYIFSLDYTDIQNYIVEYHIDRNTLSLSKISEIISIIRNKKLPCLDERGTAGSFFKNPVIPLLDYQDLVKQFPKLKSYPVSKTQVKIPAAQLIELAGLKGVFKDGVGIYQNHALILVSQGVQDGKKIVQFSQKVQQMVYELFNIFLEPEVNIVDV